MLKQLRQRFVNQLWNEYYSNSMQIQRIDLGLKQLGVNTLLLDHLAVIDLPGPHTGIPVLSKVFTALGFISQGSDYLASKQNDFTWMCEANCFDEPAIDVLPQIVIADFRLDELPPAIRNIILKYSQQVHAARYQQIEKLILDLNVSQNQSQTTALISYLMQYFSGRDWPLPTKKEFETVHEFNELLAWVLVFGRRPNHFSLSIHLLNHFANLSQFNLFIEKNLNLSLNDEGGVIKGKQEIGIAQSSTFGIEKNISLADGNVNLRTEFVEFVWRYPLNSSNLNSNKMRWKDFFTGFVGQNANYVIESLYTET